MGGSLRIYLQGLRLPLGRSDALYSNWSPRSTEDEREVVLTPYHQWGNRKPGQEMRVWLRTGAVCS